MTQPVEKARVCLNMLSGLEAGGKEEVETK